MKKFFVLCEWAAIAAVTIAFIGCGGGSTSPHQSPPVVQTPSSPPPPPPATPAKHYRLVDLVPLPGADASQANAIAKDHAAGYSVFGGFFGFPRVTVWQSDGTPEDLGVTGIGQAINSQGEVVGVVTDTATPQAFLWTQGVVTQLGTLPGFDSSIATGISDSGTIVGIAYTFQNPQNEVGFQWTSQTGMQVIEGAATADGINANGDNIIAGMSLGMHATIFSASGNIDLGTLGDFSLAAAVNNKGHAVGMSPLVSGGPVHAFFYAGTMQDLGTIQAGSDTLAVSINDNDLVIGVSNLAGHALPFVFSATTGMVDLNSLIAADSGWELATASGIDQDGKIVGSGVVSGAVHGFLLTPEN